MAGLPEEIAEKRPNTCCWIGCTGYEGLSGNGKWSNWSPYRLGRPLPQDRDELNALCVQLQKADPQTREGCFTDYRRAVGDPEWFYSTVCGFCRGVCWAQREDRIQNHRLVVESGTAALTREGAHVVASADSTEVDTPFGVRVVVSSSPGPPTRSPSLLDRAVIDSLDGDNEE